MKNYKIYINRKKRLLALYLKSIEAWEFFPVTRKGELYKQFKMTMGFDTVFTKAITAVRAENPTIPASGWEKIQVKGEFKTVNAIIKKVFI